MSGAASEPGPVSLPKHIHKIKNVAPVYQKICFQFAAIQTCWMHITAFKDVKL